MPPLYKYIFSCIDLIDDFLTVFIVVHDRYFIFHFTYV